MNSTKENPLAFFEYIHNENNISTELESQIEYYDFLTYSINLPHTIRYIELDEWNNTVAGELEIQKIFISILRREFEKAKKHLYLAFLNNKPSSNLNYLTFQFNTIQSLILNHLNIIQSYPYLLVPLRGIVKFINDRLLISGMEEFVLNESQIEFNIDDSFRIVEKSNEQLIHSIFDFMKGENERKETILSEEDFESLIEYTTFLIEEERVPKISKKLKPNLSSKDIIRFSYWVLHNELYTSSSIRPYFYQFIKEVFDNFKDNEITSIKSQFGTKGRVYSHDFLPEIITKYLSRD